MAGGQRPPLSLIFHLGRLSATRARDSARARPAASASLSRASGARTARGSRKSSATNWRPDSTGPRPRSNPSRRPNRWFGWVRLSRCASTMPPHPRAAAAIGWRARRRQATALRLGFWVRRGGHLIDPGHCVRDGTKLACDGMIRRPASMSVTLRPVPAASLAGLCPGPWAASQPKPASRERWRGAYRSFTRLPWGAGVGAVGRAALPIRSAVAPGSPPKPAGTPRPVPAPSYPGSPRPPPDAAARRRARRPSHRAPPCRR